MKGLVFVLATIGLAHGAPAFAACASHAEASWKGSPGLTLSADTSGPTCAKAVGLLVVRDKAGDPLFTWSAPTKDIFDLMDAKTAPDMKTALAAWISNHGGPGPTSDKLPEWKAGQDQPAAGEFPFMPVEWVDRPTWADIRKAKLPTLCFTQGHESLKCVVLRDGGIEDIGVQLFPG
jgi:hypothetical protein